MKRSKAELNIELWACFLCVLVAPVTCFGRRVPMRAFRPRPAVARNIMRSASTTGDASTSTESPSIFRKVFGTLYAPDPKHDSFLERLQVQKNDKVQVKVAVLDSKESRQFFGVPLARQCIQPVWIEIDNCNGDKSVILDPVALDPNYYPPREAARLCHFCNLKRMASFGLVSWMFFLPLAVLLPFKLVTASRANRQMDDFFCRQSFPLGVIGAGERAKGFVFTSLDDGQKLVKIELLSSVEMDKFSFQVPVPGLDVDYKGKRPSLEKLVGSPVNYEDLSPLCSRLKEEPRATTNSKGKREGDPVNLVVVGDFSTILTAFGARWDETETISLSTCVKTAKSFILGSQYRYSPVSALYLYGRPQDFALQRARGSISERLHLRLWVTPRQYEGKAVWVGQVSRDIGVRLAKTWNLTTHKIDPDVDEARNYVVMDILQSGHLDRVTLVDGVGESKEEDPRCNLTGDPYVTDGRRALLILSPTKTKTQIIESK